MRTGKKYQFKFANQFKIDIFYQANNL